MITVGYFQFGFGLSVRVTDEYLERDEPIDVYLDRVDEFDGEVDVDCQFVLLNRDPVKNLEIPDIREHSFTKLEDASDWFSYTCNDFTLSKILNPAEGWLHDTSLRLSVKVFVSLGFKEETLTVPVVNMESEVCECFAALLESKEFSDVEVVVGEERFDAHSQVLMARSPIFRAMFASPMREGMQKRVVIEDCEASAIRELLRFLYTGHVEPEVLDHEDSTLALLQAAHRYEARSLIEPCARALGSRLTIDTVSERLRTADLIGCSVLKSACLDFMCAHMRDVKRTSSYLRLAKQHPALLVDIIDALSHPPQKRARRQTC